MIAAVVVSDEKGGSGDQLGKTARQDCPGSTIPPWRG